MAQIGAIKRRMTSPPRISDVLARIKPGLTGSSDDRGRTRAYRALCRFRADRGAGDAGDDQRDRGRGAGGDRASLAAGHQSLGIHLDVSHTAATPVGLRVTATAEVVRLEGRTVTFRVEARDDFESIGGGSHQRVVVSVARFDERVQRKLRGVS